MNESLAFGHYAVTQINGNAVRADSPRSRYAISYFDTGLVVALGCGSVSMSGALVNGLFVPSGSADQAMYTTSGSCSDDPDRLEPEIVSAAHQGKLHVTGDQFSLMLTTTTLEVLAQRQSIAASNH